MDTIITAGSADQMKSYQGSDMLPIQLDMALAALGWGTRDLAARAAVSLDTIARFKRGETLRDRTVAAIKATLEASGVEFIPENGGGPGVRLRKGYHSEGQGGFADGA
jgi:DNA-binding Xre family transcriptional regulator